MKTIFKTPLHIKILDNQDHALDLKTHYEALNL